MPEEKSTGHGRIQWTYNLDLKRALVGGCLPDGKAVKEGIRMSNYLQQSPSCSASVGLWVMLGSGNTFHPWISSKSITAAKWPYTKVSFLLLAFMGFTAERIIIKLTRRLHSILSSPGHPSIPMVSHILISSPDQSQLVKMLARLHLRMIEHQQLHRLPARR